MPGALPCAGNPVGQRPQKRPARHGIMGVSRCNRRTNSAGDSRNRRLSTGPRFMTMLDRMRRHSGWLKWSLGLVVVSFIFLYIPQDCLQRGAPRDRPPWWRASKGGEISAGQFQRVYSSRCRPTGSAYGGNIDDRLLKQLGIDQRIVQQLIEEEAVAGRGGRLGITASDAEVREPDRGAAGLPGERPVRRRPALPPGPADAERRRCAPASSKSRSAAAS